MSSYGMSQAAIEAERKAELERQRQERLRIIIKAMERYNALFDRLDAFRVKVSLSMKNELQAFASNEELSFACESFSSVKSDVENGIVKELSESSLIPTEPEDIQALSDKLQNSISVFEDKYNMGLSEFSNRLEIYDKGKAELSKSHELANALDKIEKEKRIEYSNVNFDYSGLLQDDITVEQDTDYEDVISECVLLANNNAISKADKSRLLGIINELQQNMELAAVTIHQYQVLRSTILKNIRLFNELYSKYTLLHTERRSLTINEQSPVEPLLPKNGFASLEDLENEVKRLDQAIRIENEQSYIRQQIDEVMQENGFNISETFIMHKMTKGQNLLFESNNMDIHLFMSEKGSVMFEPVGIAGLDENEHSGYDGMFAESISDAEKAAIYQDQIEFCKLFPKIEKELKKRGIILSDTMLPDADINDVKLLQIKGKQRKRKQSELSNDVKKRLHGKDEKQRALK